MGVNGWIWICLNEKDRGKEGKKDGFADYSEELYTGVNDVSISSVEDLYKA